MMPRKLSESILVLALGTSAFGCQTKGRLCEESPGALYERRVEPLFSADRPSTCSQCHGGGIALADYARSEPCDTMACLIEGGLVNLDYPERSVILSFIDRASPESELITAQIIAEERAGFLSWIEHEAACRACAGAVCGSAIGSTCEAKDDLSGSYDQDTDPLDCERETIEKLFRGTVYEERARCNPCHFQEEENAAKDAYRWLSRTGDCQVASLASLRNVEEQGYIDVNAPDQSLLLLKPLAEIQGGLPHGGHDKFAKDGDGAYAAFLYFLARYGACATGDDFWPPPLGGASGL